MSELDALGVTSSYTTQVSDKVRLITDSEYRNMTPYYKTIDNNRFPNVENISKITSNYASWLYCNSSNCGSVGNGYWWTMGSDSTSVDSYVKLAMSVESNGQRIGHGGYYAYGVRPVITIVK